MLKHLGNCFLRLFQTIQDSRWAAVVFLGSSHMFDRNWLAKVHFVYFFGTILSTRVIGASILIQKGCIFLDIWPFDESTFPFHISVLDPVTPKSVSFHDSATLMGLHFSLSLSKLSSSLDATKSCSPSEPTTSSSSS